MVLIAIVIAAEIVLIAGLYYLRATSSPAIVRSDIVTIYIPVIVAAALCAWVIRTSAATGGPTQSMLFSIVVGIAASVLAAVAAVFVGFNLWGT
jgi:hypothetical protein